MTPSSLHRSLMLVSGCPMDAAARRTLAGVILNGRPPVRPRARAEANPATVRSEIRARSFTCHRCQVTLIVVGLAYVKHHRPLAPKGATGVRGWVTALMGPPPSGDEQSVAPTEVSSGGTRPFVL